MVLLSSDGMEDHYADPAHKQYGRLRRDERASANRSVREPRASCNGGGRRGERWRRGGRRYGGDVVDGMELHVEGSPEDELVDEGIASLAGFASASVETTSVKVGNDTYTVASIDEMRGKPWCHRVCWCYMTRFVATSIHGPVWRMGDREGRLVGGFFFAILPTHVQSRPF